MSARFFLSLLLLAVALGAAADKVRLRSERVAMPDEVLVSTIWDATTLSEIDSRARASVGLGKSGLIFENVRPGFTDLYLLRGDSIYFRGLTYGRDMGVLLDDTVGVATAMRGEISLASDFSGSVRFVNGRRGCVSGHCFAETGKPGRFIFAPGDTITAVQMRERRSTVSDMPDPGLTGTVEFVRWYIPGEELPFAVQFHEGDDEPRLFLCADLPDITEADDEANTDDDILSRVLGSTSIDISAGGVTVRFGGAERVRAEVSIFDAMGHLYAFSECSTGSEESVYIETRNLAPGNYLAMVMLDGKPEFSIKKGFSL